NDGGPITTCYAIGSVSGNRSVGGLVGSNYSGPITTCYAAGSVICYFWAGGLVGSNFGQLTTCFWDIQSSGKTHGVGNMNPDPSGVAGLDTAAMMTLSTFTDAEWDFTNETAKGTNDIWRMCSDGLDYPHLNWESIDGDFSCPDGVNAEDLNYYVGYWLTNNCTMDNNYCGGADLNLSGAVDLGDWAIFAANWLNQ
ncbi:MAG: hypothetical protein JW828_15835, partial [Sedimentisphaerales bacterium]|nr:hypothetical protein [Sedimentisphaerales bacterium]